MSETDLEIASPKPLPDEPVKEEPVAEPEKEEAQEETTTEPTEAQPEEPESGDDAPEEEKPKKPRRNLQKRISQLTQQRQQAQQEAAQLRQQLEAVQSQTQPVAEPKQDDFKSYDEFNAAHTRWLAADTVRQELEKAGQAVQQSQSQAEQAARAADWGLKLEDARDRYDDFDEVAQNPDLPVSPAMAEAIQEAENGADVAYFLGNNPKVAREIATLTPMQAVMQIGKIADKLANPPQRKQTTAPPPPKTVQGGGVAPQKDPSKMSMAEYRKFRGLDKE